jgi:hypothetical protein
MPVLSRPRLRRVVPLVPVDGQPLAVVQDLRREIEELRAELAAVRAWCEGLEDEQACSGGIKELPVIARPGEPRD